MVKLEDIPNIPKDSDSLRVEVQWGEDEGREGTSIHIAMFYLIKKSIHQDKKGLRLYGKTSTNIPTYCEHKDLNLSQIASIQPLTYDL